jgi:hypothetical protein
LTKALQFIEAATSPSGALGLGDPLAPDYPNYATSLAVRSLSRFPGEKHAPLVGRMVCYLEAQQFNEENGWPREHPVYGAWGMGGTQKEPPNTGHADLSMTRHVLQALAAAQISTSASIMQRARVFLYRCQNFPLSKISDGGFFFSTVILEANKAGRDGEGFRSYGTATADGLLSLLATGHSREDERLQAARRWLISRGRADVVPGFEGYADTRWQQGLWYYHAAAAAEASRRGMLDADPELSAQLISRQRSDGSWSNPEPLVKEDDPLIATGFAMRALAPL